MKLFAVLGAAVLASSVFLGPWGGPSSSSSSTPRVSLPATSPRPDPPVVREQPVIPSPAVDRASYKLGPTDQLNIDVVGELELSGKWLVDDAGYISYPYLNRLSVQGLTAIEVEDKLRSMLQAGFLRNPQVRVEIGQYKSQKVIIMGEVKVTGTLVLQGSSVSLLEALGQAGSTTAAASALVTVTRPRRGDQESQSFHIDLRSLDEAEALILQDGDVIKVPKAETFYINGNVRNPGTYVIDGKLSLEQAVTTAGGLNDRGTYRGATANRDVNGKPTTIKLGKNDLVKPGDVVTIATRIF